MRLITRAYVVNNQRNYAQIDAEWLLKSKTNDGLIALSARTMAKSVSCCSRTKPHRRKAPCNNGAPFNNQLLPRSAASGHATGQAQTLLAAQLAAQTHTPLVATHAIQFLNAETTARTRRGCAWRGDILANPRRKNAFEPCQYLLTQAEMQARLPIYRAHWRTR